MQKHWLELSRRLPRALVASGLIGCCLFGVSCGGSGDGRSDNTGGGVAAESGLVSSNNTLPETSTSIPVQATGTVDTGSVADPAAASRFLAQTTFGPTTESISALSQTTFADWITNQFNLPVSSMRDSFDAEQTANPDSAPSRDWVFEAFWQQAVEAPDQLRQRLAFALSQIFVISLREGAVAGAPRGVADFYSMLAHNAFGNFRTLIENVTLHPMMGAYLSHLGNEKGDASVGRVPDENFAREIMQLFTIGVHELNEDGSIRLSADGTPIETYNTADVQGLARVFTGFSWGGPDTSIGRFQGWVAAPEREILTMQAYPHFHSRLEKRFLNVVIPAQPNGASAEADLKIALDALFNHPNLGPFIGKQLIQRLVTSNPDAAYIARVSAKFKDNGFGVRGDMKAVIEAILLDTSARDLALAKLPGSGRIREPILRMAHWMRSFNALSASGKYQLWGTDDPATSLGMTVLRSPSVFNFYRPGYVPPQTPIADAGLVAPEMQITHETSIAGYLNAMLDTVELGGGFLNEIKSEYRATVAVAHETESLIDHINLLLLYGSMSNELRQLIGQAVNTIPLSGPSADPADDALLKRAGLAVYLAMASPEYIVLK